GHLVAVADLPVVAEVAPRVATLGDLQRDGEGPPVELHVEEFPRSAHLLHGGHRELHGECASFTSPLSRPRLDPSRGDPAPPDFGEGFVVGRRRHTKEPLMRSRTNLASLAAGAAIALAAA